MKQRVSTREAAAWPFATEAGASSNSPSTLATESGA